MSGGVEGQVPVTQADRDRAKSLLGRDDAGPSWWSIDSGNADNDLMVQAFARHRIVATADNARLLETVANAQAFLKELTLGELGPSKFNECKSLYLALAAIREQNGKAPADGEKE